MSGSLGEFAMLDLEIEKVSKQGAPPSAPLLFGAMRRAGVMRKSAEKAEKKPATTAKRGSKKSPKLELVRKKITTLVGNKAVKMVASAIDEAGKGQFPAMKYLFEMTGLYPVEGQEDPPEERSLAGTLLHRLGVPEIAAGEVAGAKCDPGEATAAAAHAVK